MSLCLHHDVKIFNLNMKVKAEVGIKILDTNTNFMKEKMILDDRPAEELDETF